MEVNCQQFKTLDLTKTSTPLAIETQLSHTEVMWAFCIHISLLLEIIFDYMFSDLCSNELLFFMYIKLSESNYCH